MLHQYIAQFMVSDMSRAVHNTENAEHGGQVRWLLNLDYDAPGDLGGREHHIRETLACLHHDMIVKADKRSCPISRR